MDTESPHPAADSARPRLAERSLVSLDWAVVLEALAERAATIAGRERCEALPFLSSAREARRALEELQEMLDLYELEKPPPLGGISDIRGALLGAAKGEVLGVEPLLDVAHTLEGTERLRKHLGRDPEDAELLWGIAQQIEPLPDLSSRLSASFDSRGELSASTYPQLHGLRSKKARLHQKIQATMASLRQDDRFGEALQDDFLGMRNDRYVLPVKASSKRAGLGIVHDASGSGQTVFIEPYEVIESNNELKMADAELEREERRILRSLTERVAFFGAGIRASFLAATRIDVIHAKAVLARDLDAVVPHLDDQPGFKMKDARHPVLALRGIEVVPNDLELGGEQRALVLSGPNTGGKTVTLKTLGLAALMVRAGLPVLAAPESRVGWVDQVLTDIGDSQDVNSDLSTFSGHVLNLVEILSALDEGGAGSGLVLLDEIAAGTDPVQGAAFGRAVLEAMLARGALLATTTHYPELKGLAALDPRFVGARVEFDGGEGRPTYRVTVGRIGSSHALDVASALGVPAPVLQAARDYLGDARVAVEEMLAGAETEMKAARIARAEAEGLRAEAAEKRREAEERLVEVRREKRELKRQLRIEFDREVLSYRETVQAQLKALRREQTTRAAERARQRIAEGADATWERIGRDAPTPADLRIDWDLAKVGDPVRLGRLGREGRIVALADARGRVTIEVLGGRMQVKRKELEKALNPQSIAPPPKPAPKKAPPPTDAGRKRRGSAAKAEPESRDPGTATRAVNNVLDLRGQRVDESLANVEQFLDDAAMEGREFAFLLHGVGTGALLQAVRQYVRKAPYVAAWAPGTRDQGGEGITVVRLKD